MPPRSNNNLKLIARVREFQEPDQGNVRQLMYRTIDQCYAGVYPPRAVQFFKDFHSEEHLAERHRKGTILVVETAGNIVATGALMGSEIFGVFVDPGFQRRGFGKALMRELEKRAVEQGGTEVELSVSLPSKAFYERLGYEIVEESSIDVGEGQRLDFWKARKQLAESI